MMMKTNKKKNLSWLKDDKITDVSIVEHSAAVNKKIEVNLILVSYYSSRKYV